MNFSLKKNNKIDEEVIWKVVRIVRRAQERVKILSRL